MTSALSDLRTTVDLSLLSERRHSVDFIGRDHPGGNEPGNSHNRPYAIPIMALKVNPADITGAQTAEEMRAVMARAFKAVSEQPEAPMTGLPESVEEEVRVLREMVVQLTGQQIRMSEAVHEAIHRAEDEAMSTVMGMVVAFARQQGVDEFSITEQAMHAGIDHYGDGHVTIEKIDSGVDPMLRISGISQ